LAHLAHLARLGENIGVFHCAKWHAWDGTLGTLARLPNLPSITKIATQGCHWQSWEIYKYIKYLVPKAAKCQGTGKLATLADLTGKLGRVGIPAFHDCGRNATLPRPWPVVPAGGTTGHHLVIHLGIQGHGTDPLPQGYLQSPIPPYKGGVLMPGHGNDSPY
jgi:hypothetical protein